MNVNDTDETSEKLAEIGQLINSNNVMQRKRALEVLSGLPDWHRHTQIVEKFLADPDAGVQSEAIKQISGANPTPYVQTLRELAGTTEGAVQTLCLKTLAALNSPKSATVILEGIPFQEEPVQKVLFECLVNLMKDETEETGPHVLQALNATESKVKRAALFIYLKQADSAKAILELIKFCQGVSAEVRNDIFNELKPYQELLLDFIKTALSGDCDPKLRVMILNLATHLEHEDLASLLLTELDGDDWLLRQSAIRGLGNMKCKEALPKILEALDDEDLSIAAIGAIASFGDIALAKDLFKKLGKATNSEQVEIVEALGRMGDKRFVQPLINYIGSDKCTPDGLRRAKDIVKDICEKTGTAVPAELAEIEQRIIDEALEDIPDLGLKISDNL